MPKPGFEWDETKAANNAEKHGVSFDEASTVFEDRNAVTQNDPLHSEHEDRHLLLGYSSAGRRLLVSYTHRHVSIRIISAREVAGNQAAG